MKKYISILTFIFAMQHAQSQIGGNAVYNGNEYNNGYINSLNHGVNLQLEQSHGYSFSNVLEASVMANVKASAFVAIFSLTQHGATIDEADKMMNLRIDEFKVALEKDHIQPSDFFTDPVSLVPVYETEVINKKYSRTYNEVPAGFEMKKNVHIVFKDHQYINRIITHAASAEIYDLVKADYVVDDLEKVLAGLREEAVNILLRKKALLEKAGMQTKFIQMGEKFGSVYPVERYQQYYAYKTGTSKSYYESYRSSLVKRISYNYAEKNKTIYYDKVSDKQFDKVINPVVGEPMVQVFVSLKSQYQLYDPVAEKSDKEYQLRMRDITEKEAALRLLEKEKQIELMGKKGK